MQTIENYNFAGKKAIVRVDFNVPLDENGNITDDTRIRGAVPTLKKILADGGALIVMSHMGKPKGKVNPKMSLAQIKDAVAKVLDADVKFAPDCAKAADAAAALKPGEVLLLENLRFYPEEEGKPVGIDKEDPGYDAAKKALKEMERLCRTEPDNQHYRVLLAHAYMENKQSATAYNLLTEVKAQDPDNGEALIFLADYYEQQGQTQAMMQEMTDLVERPGISFEHKMYTLMYLLGKQSDDSVLIQHSFDRILEQYPEEYAIHEQYVRWLLQHGEKDKAREELRNVLDMNPNQLEVWKD